MTMIILYSKSRTFLVTHCGLFKPKRFYGLSLLETMSDQIWRAFHPRGDLSVLADTRHIFFFITILINRATLLDIVPFTKPTQSNTKRNVDLPNMHSQPFNVMSLCICNARCHFMLYYVTCIMNGTWTKQSTPLTSVMDNHIT